VLYELSSGAGFRSMNSSVRPTMSYVSRITERSSPPRPFATGWAGLVSARCSSSRARPGKSGYVESFNGKLRAELLDREIFYTLKEAKDLIETWRQQYNRVRPHSSLGYRPPALEATSLKPATLRFAGLNNLLSAPSY